MLELNQLQRYRGSVRWHNYNFRFNVNAVPDSARFQRLEIGSRPTFNEFASGIADIRIKYIEGSRMRITIVTGCDKPQTLEGSVCVRHKHVRIL
jgi:hypothetical protein